MRTRRARRMAERASQAEVVTLRRGPRRGSPEGGAPAAPPPPVSTPLLPVRAEVVDLFREAARGWERPERVRLDEREERERGPRRIVGVGT